MILKMSKVSIIGPQRLLPEVMDSVYKAGVIHIESPPDSVKDTPFVGKVALTSEQKREMAELEGILNIAKKTISILTPLIKGDRRIFSNETLLSQRLTNDDENVGSRVMGHGSCPSPLTLDPCPWFQKAFPCAISIEEAKVAIEELSNSVESMNSEIRRLEQELSLYHRYEKALSALASLIEIIPESPFMDHTGITLYKREAALPLLKDALQRITGGRHELFKKDIDEDITACIVVYPKEFATGIKKILHEENISELRMPAGLSDMPVMESLRIILEKKTNLPARIKDIEDRLRKLAYERYSELDTCIRIIGQRLEQMSISSDLYGTRNTFFIYGWIPTRLLTTFRDVLKERFQNMVLVDVVSPGRLEMENIPVVLSNNCVIRPFEVLTRFLSLPKYGTFDPTPLLALFFPLFFGLILGDIGYGTVIFLSSLWLRWRRKESDLLRDMGSIFMISSVMAIIFGFVFGEFFGDLGGSIGIHPMIDRSKTLIPFLIFTVIIGGLHISIGLLIGIIISINRRETKEAIARVLKLIFVFSLFSIAATLYGILPPDMGMDMLNIIIILTVVIVLALFFVEKWLAPFNLMKLIVNTISYARIMGFGAASIFLSSIANRMSAMPRNIFLGIAIGVFFHIINLAVGLYAPAIQTLRLHYVEFFDKFFYPGGREYKPFGGKAKI